MKIEEARITRRDQFTRIRKLITILMISNTTRIIGRAA